MNFIRFLLYWSGMTVLFSGVILSQLIDPKGGTAALYIGVSTLVSFYFSVKLVTSQIRNEKNKDLEIQNLKARLEENEADYISKLGAEKEHFNREVKIRDDIDKIRIQLEEWQSTAEEFANFYANDHLNILCKKLNSNNYESTKTSLEKVFERMKKKKITFPKEDEREFFFKLKDAFKTAVRKEEARLEQHRIKEQIREEQRAEKERALALKKMEEQERAISEALERALSEAEDKHSEEIEALKKQLEEVKAQNERAKSQAQLTKSGHVYVISNLGSFGEEIYKVGMTRRLEPMDRVKELGDASVPFPFDVHMMISSDNAPELEHKLHKALHRSRVNKVNLRKEYFKASLEEIKSLVEENHGEVEYEAEMEALEFRETLLIEENGDYDSYFDEETINKADEFDDESEDQVA